MSTLEIYDTAAATAPADRNRLTSFFRRLWAAHKRRRAERKMVLTIASLDDRLLRDVGIEPQDVIAAMNGRRAHSILFNPMRTRTERD